MIEATLENVTWLFSGVGLVAAVAALKFLRGLKFSAPAKFLTRVSEYIISAFRSSEDIAEGLNLDLRPRSNPLELWLHELPKSQVWIRVVNLNPLSLGIKSISLEFAYGGLISKSKVDLHRKVVHKHSMLDRLLVVGDLTGEQADYIAGYMEDPQCRIIIRAVFKAPFKEVCYESGWLEGVPVKLINHQQRKSRVPPDSNRISE